jgi:cell division transport system permease protein
MKKGVRILSRLRIGKNIIRDGIKGVWRHRGMGFASVFSVTTMLLMLGAMLLILLNINIFMRDTQESVGDITIFLLEEITAEDAKAVDDHLRDDAGIAELRFYTKEEAYEIFKDSWEEKGYLLEGMVGAFQPYYVVVLADINESHQFVSDIRTMPGVDLVNYSQDLIDRIEAISRTVQYAGIIVVAALVLISFFVISNTIKLTVVAREKEIEVMRYVGAGSGMIEGPFVIEGMLFGLVGAAVAFLLIYLGYRELFERYSEQFFQLSSSQMMHPLLIRKEFVIIFAVMGAGVGMLGSLFSLRKYRRI